MEDLGGLGAAVNRHALRRQFEILREMGFLIVSEGFDMWERPKTPYDYARFYPE